MYYYGNKTIDLLLLWIFIFMITLTIKKVINLKGVQDG